MQGIKPSSWVAVAIALLVIVLVAWQQLSGGVINFWDDGTFIAERGGVDVLSGTGINVTSADDPANSRVRYTITASIAALLVQEEDVSVETAQTLDFGPGFDVAGGPGGEANVTLDSSEAGFLASGAITCGAATAGRIAVHTTPLQYCDNAGVPALQYAAYGDSAGAATALACTSTCVNYSEIVSVDVAADEECLTFETTGSTLEWQTCGAGGGAPTDATYVVMSLDATLSAERVLTAGAGIGLADGGANGNATLTWSPVTQVLAFTLFDSSAASRTITFGLSGATDPVLTLSDGAFNVSTGTIQQAGTAVVLQTRTLTGGAGIAAIGDLSADRTITFDATELTGLTWSAGGSASFTWTYNVSVGTDPVITFGDGVVNVSTGTLQQGGTAVVLQSRTLTGGAGIAAIGDLSADRTVAFDATELGALTWGDSSLASYAWTFALSGATDPVLTLSNNAFNVSTGQIQEAGTRVVLYTRTLTGGTGISALGDLSADRTVSFDATELSGLTWSAGGSASFTWTYDLSGTDPIITFASNAVNVSTGQLQEGGTRVVLYTRTLTGGAGIAALGDLSADRTVATASGETDFLASGALTCGAATQGRAQVHTTPLQYCDNAGTPALQYAAYGDSSGNATGLVCTGCVGSTDLADEAVTEAKLDALDAAGDEECLTFEATGSRFEWQACGAGGSFSGEVDDTTNGSLTLTTDDASPPGNTVRALFARNTNDLRLNVPTSGVFQVTVNGSEGAAIEADRIVLPRSAGVPSSDAENDLWLNTQLRQPEVNIGAAVKTLTWQAQRRVHELQAARAGGTQSPCMTQRGFSTNPAPVGTVASQSSENSSACRFTTGAVSGNDAGLDSPETGNEYFGRVNNPLAIFRVLIDATTTIRVFWGFSDQTLATTCSADNPAGNHVGVSYSTPRGDANWQYVTKDGATQTVTNSSIAVDTSYHTWIIYQDNTNSRVVFRQDEGAETLVTATLPTNTTGLTLILCVETESASASYFQIKWFRAWNDN